VVCRAALRLSLWDDAPQALITYVQSNKANDNDWFTVRSRCPPERPPHAPCEPELGMSLLHAVGASSLMVYGWHACGTVWARTDTRGG
jgi:hypothetical protein